MVKTRAENYTLEELKNIRPINTFLSSKIKESLSKDRDSPTVLLAPKGQGKTLNLRHAISELVEEDRNITPAMFMFKNSDKLETLDPEKIATKETWGERFEVYENKKGMEIFNSCNPIIIDDVHYMGESVIEGKKTPEFLSGFLEDVASEVDKGKNIMLVSESQLSHYADQIENESLDDILLRFGEVRPGKLHSIRDKDILNNLRSYNASSVIEIPPLEINDLSTLFDRSNIKIDDRIVNFLYDNSDRNPRSFVNFVNQFESSGKTSLEESIWDGRKKTRITYDSFKDLAKEKLESIGINGKKLELYSMMMENPSLEHYPHPSSFPHILGKFRSYNKLENFLEKIESKKSEVIEQIKNRMSNLDHQENKYSPPEECSIKELRTYNRKWNKRNIINDIVNEKLDIINEYLSNENLGRKEYWSLIKNWKDLKRGLIQANINVSPIKEIKGDINTIYDIYKHANNLKDKFRENITSEKKLNSFVWKTIPENYIPIRRTYNIRGNVLALNEPFKLAFSDTLYSGTYLNELIKTYNNTGVVEK